MEMGRNFIHLIKKAGSEKLLDFMNLILAPLSRTTTTKENEVPFQPAEFALKERNIVNYFKWICFCHIGQTYKEIKTM